MDYEVEAPTIARSTSDDNVYGISGAPEPLEDAVEADSSAAQDVETATTLISAEPSTIGTTRASYGIADILFPMTPPKPKGARLIRGPLRFT
jgi:hypothetical protein